MHDFARGFVAGLRATPRGYFAPVLVVWCLFLAAVAVAEEKAPPKMGR